ncbi:ATP-dependent nuclease [Bacillus sp. T3]|uniref:ATP-dependent nuclease n=1 Tax=Bacillus sp. T3 TaxID=467262 RepID=UPI002980D90B|nr:AAA family ATPase [Bacillus sp. T3]
MKLKSLEVKNFRNFEEVNINLTNQNVIFGMNDVGKTNLMYALRFLLDRDVRKNGFKESDYFKNDTSKVISITLGIDLEDRETDNDSKHVIAKVGRARSGTGRNLDNFFIRIKGVYDESENLGIPKIYWGNKVDELEELLQNGILSPLDSLFKVVYLDPTIDLESTFSKNRRKLFDQTKLSDSDVTISNDIKGIGKQLNEKISSMEVIQSFQSTITSEYKKLKKENISIEMKSEISINGYFGNLIPYIKRDNDDNIYPTSGDGRKKILAYSLWNHLIKAQEGNKIIIYLIEEPENSLHRSMQIALSKQLFESEVYTYFFLSTHSSELLYEMDNASLIRIYSQNKTNCESYIYHVEDKYKEVKKELNRSLATALFAEKVLLVEGPSEKVLFEKILEEVYPTYELDGGYLLEVNGINFEPYVKVLKALDIKPIVKTDNDLKAKKGSPKIFDLIGLNRCLRLIEAGVKGSVEINYFILNDEKKEVKDLVLKEILVKSKKLQIFGEFESEIKTLMENKIFLSKIDLEHDLFEAIGERMVEILGDSPIDYLQNSKLLNMIELTKELTKEDCNNIFNHELFKALKELVPNAS